MPYQITEPHPTTLPNHYVHTGRGGAGNTCKPSSKPVTSNSALHTISSHSTFNHPNGKFSAGRGGAGNIHPTAEAPSPFSFDEEVNLQSARERNHDIYHVGRGGAGNWTRKPSKDGKDRKMSNESWQSSNSGSSTKSGFLGRLSDVFERR